MPSIKLIRANGKAIYVPFNPMIEIVAIRVPAGPPKLKFRFEEEDCQTMQNSLEAQKTNRKRTR